MRRRKSYGFEIWLGDCLLGDAVRRGTRETHDAFTLIELLIVVAIIAILAAIAVPNFLEAQVRAKVSRAKTDIRTLVTALESYRTDNNRMPDGESCTGPPGPWYAAYGGFVSLGVLTTPIAYMTALPEENPFGPFTSEMVASGEEPVRGYAYSGGEYHRTMLPVWIEQYRVYHSSYWASDYLFFCVGPSKRFSTWAPGGGFLVPYDPSNGTRSMGDIIYVGGAGQAGGWHSFN